MSKKHTRKPAPVYPPSWYEIKDPAVTAAVATSTRKH